MLFTPRDRQRSPTTGEVVGLRGTGSDTYTVSDLFVPSDFSVCRDTDAERREPGTLYQFSTTNMYASGFAGVALGIARSALLDDFAWRS